METEHALDGWIYRWLRSLLSFCCTITRTRMHTYTVTHAHTHTHAKELEEELNNLILIKIDSIHLRRAGHATSARVREWAG